MNRQKSIMALTATAALLASVPLRADTITWTGNVGTSWNDPGNWDGDVPGADDTAVFDATGTLAASAVVSLDANQTIAKLVIARTSAFTIGAVSDVTEGYVLTLTEVDRQDVLGTEGNHTLAVEVALAGDSEWTVNGSGYLQSTSAAGITGAYTLTKLGSGQLRVGNNGYTGNTYVLEGDLYLTANVGIRGNNLYVGASDGSTTATCTRNTNNSVTYITSSCSITVYPGSYCNAGRESFKNLTVDNGSANLATYCYLSGHVYLTGGTVTGGSGNRMVNIYTFANHATALISSSVIQYNAATWIFDTSDGAAPVDLEISGPIGGTSSHSLRKDGEGTLLLSRSAGNTYSYLSTIVNKGTLLVGNTSGSGTGNSLVDVRAGSTLGGIGIIGGVEDYTKSDVTLSGTSTSALATMAPGMVDATTGKSLIGTLTVGSTIQTHNVTFGNHSRLVAQVDADGNADRLTVFGTLDLSSASNGLDLEVDPDAKSGTYVLASATEGITGEFTVVSGLPPGVTLAHNAADKTVELTLPAKNTVLLIR